MQERRGERSSLDELWSTISELSLSFEHADKFTRDRRGLTRRGERIFNVGSVAVVLLFAFAWSWSITSTYPAGDLTGERPSATRIISRALSDPKAPSAAYLTDAAVTLFTPLRGESGKLRVRLQQPGEAILRDTLPAGTVATFSSGTAAESSAVLSAPKRPGIWSLALSAGTAIKSVADFSVITLMPASQKRNGRIGLYYIGNWPKAQKTARAIYIPPGGFIEVTRETQNTRLSEHFRVRDFFPHDQANVWPKYIVVDMKLIDKMELILSDLQRRGIKTHGVRVMSGFRTPQYNRGGGDPRGRATLSRHMYGDAADIFIDNDGNGNMDDLNGDGRVNIRDNDVIRQAALRVEAAHPSLIGGIGVYAATSAHGPFVHIDTRGYPARWTGSGDG